MKQMVKIYDLTEKRTMMMKKEMVGGLMHGKGLMQMRDLGSLFKRMNLGFSALLTTKPFSMLSIVDVYALQHLSESRKASFVICTLSSIYLEYVNQTVFQHECVAASDMDYKPSRMVVIARQVEAFIREFFDQNPLSQIGLVTLKDGVAHSLTDLGGSPESHIKVLMGKLECSGDASLQNGLDLVHSLLNQIPTYGHREVLILYSSLSTCDPGDVLEAIQKCKSSKIRCSVIGLSAELYVCKCLCQETGGSYYVALDESHLKELILEHAPPPPAIAEFAIPNLIKMGFPQRAAEGVISICSCHKEAKSGGGYICPRCRARICELPSECRICGLTLVSSPHLARSYHHLFPITPFDDASPSLSNDPRKLPKNCFGCQQSLLNPGNFPAPCVSCPKCKQHFCLDCDIYIHESLHNCPGCEGFRHSKSIDAMEG